VADHSELLERIEKALNNLVTMRIVTAVGTVTVSVAEDGTMTEKHAVANARGMVTEIDLIQGDIRTYVDPAFVNGDYQSLRAFHAEREKEGAAIIQQNLQTLKALYEWVDAMVKDEA
jgi:hypothetical protein